MQSWNANYYTVMFGFVVLNLMTLEVLSLSCYNLIIFVFIDGQQQISSSLKFIIIAFTCIFRIEI
jgi:hypothetical protein